MSIYHNPYFGQYDHEDLFKRSTDTMIKVNLYLTLARIGIKLRST